MTDILNQPITRLASQLRAHTLTIPELIEEVYKNIERYNNESNALITVVDKQTALKQAEVAQMNLDTATSPLFGLPYVLKDSYLTKGIKTTAASNVLKAYQAQYDATVYKKLQDAGAILVGKANMDAWGHGATSENTDFGSVKNAWNTSRVAGGSSGGCAVAVSLGMSMFAIGEDTGGSIRNPASWNNITGLKVTYGRVSRYGCIAYASSFDTVGPMAKTAEDCACVLEAIAGQDPYDASSAREAVPSYVQAISKLKKETVVGVPKEFMTDVLKPEIKAGIEQVIDVLKDNGLKIKEISMPTLEFALPLYYLIGLSETSSNLARYDGVRYGGGRDLFRDENKRRIMIGSYALSAGYYDAYYRKALQARTLLIKDYNKALNEADVLLMPVTTSVATKLGEKIEDPLENMMLDLFTTSQNPAGIPALAVPAGFDKENNPFGVQFVGKKFSETTLLQLAYMYQQKTDWHRKMPEFSTQNVVNKLRS